MIDDPKVNGFSRDPRLDQVRVQVVKLADNDNSPLETRAIQNLEDDREFFQAYGAIEPPYDPRLLVVLYEHSNALRQNVDAYATNIDGFGHSFKAVIDLEADSTLDEVRTLIALERQDGREDDARVQDKIEEPTEAEVKQRILELANEQRLESLKLSAFFDDCSEISFVDLRRRTREDEEITGNGYWEVLRDRTGRIAAFNYVESFTVRICKLDEEFVEYKQKRRTLTQQFEEVTRRKRFRRYVQKVGSRAVFFKEFGDPRVVSSASGRAYPDADAMQKEEENARPATEMMHFRIPSSRTPYGVPRWIGNLLSVMGSRQSEDVNFQYFENKSVPPLAVLVSGGRLTKDSVSKLESFIQNEIRGTKNFHKILIIEAEGAESTAFENSGRMKIELKPLTEAQTSDALFQQYDERNIDKVGMSFRIPRMLRGDTRDFNRSCYSEDTETLTEHGWKLHHQIGPTEKVAAFDKETGEVVFVVPAQKLVYDVKDELMVRFESAHVDILVTDNHRMLLRSAPDGAWEVHEAAKVPYAEFLVARAVVTGVIEADGSATYYPHFTREFFTVSAAHVRRERYTGRVYCFSVPEYGFFVTRRNGKIAIQGNTAMAALDFAERQVFEPERQSFDYRMNRDVLPSLGIRHWKLKSNGPTQRDPESLAKMIHDLQDFMTPNILMELSQGVFNRNFPRIEAEWADQPLKLTLATVNKVPGDTPEAEDTDPDNQAPGNEPEQTDAKSDNQGEKKGPERQIGGPGGGSQKAPKKQRPQPARKSEDPLADVAGLLVDVRDNLRSAVIRAAEERIAQRRAGDANGDEGFIE